MKVIKTIVNLLILLVLMCSCEGVFPNENITTTECEHNYISNIKEKSTCAKTGVEEFVCSICSDSYTVTIEKEPHSYVEGICSVCGKENKSYLNELFGDDIDIYTNDMENPYNIDLDKYGSDVNVYFYEPNISTIIDPYVNVNKTEFYENYESATTYEDSYFRSKHYLMSGDISEQYYMPTEGKIEKDGKAVRITTATYILDTKGAYLAYIPNVIDGNNFIVFYGGAYTSLNEVAAYLLAFGEVPVNQISNKGSSGQRTAISQWGIYGRVNDSNFSGDTSKYPYEPELPKIKTLRYKEMDFGTTGGYTNSNSLGTNYRQTLYNNGSKISRGAARFVYVNDDSVTRIDDRYVFYTYNHYNDFQEYLNYYNGWGVRFGNQSAGNEYCGDSSDFYALNCDRPTAYPLTLLQKYSEII